MSENSNIAGEPDSARLEFERIQGALDAALVFALSADQEYQNGNLELAAACQSDAAGLYDKTVAALPKANLTGAQLQDIKAMLIRLQNALHIHRASRRNEAA